METYIFIIITYCQILFSMFIYIVQNIQKKI